MGTVRKEGDDIQVTAKLIDARDNTIIWQSTYERILEEIFSIQCMIAGEIAAALKAELLPEEKLLLQKNPTENMKAYDLYTLGRLYWNKRTAKDIEKSIDYYEQAKEIDQGFRWLEKGIP